MIDHQGNAELKNKREDDKNLAAGFPARLPLARLKTLKTLAEAYMLG